jgi:hypothetical protein
VLEHVDYQALLQRIEALENSSFQSGNNFDRIQNLAVRTVALEAAQEEVKHSFEGVTLTALKYQDSIKSLTRGLALLQTSVSTDLSILKQNIDGLASSQAAQIHIPNQVRMPAQVQVPAPLQDPAPFNVCSTQSQVGIPLLTSQEHTASFAPQVFQPPATNLVVNSANNQIPVYTTAAAATSNNLLVTNWLDSHNFSSIRQAFHYPGINANATPLDHGHATRERSAPHGFCEPATAPRPRPLVSTGREANHVPRHAPIHSPVIDRHSNYSNSSGDESRLSSLNIQGKMLKGQMNGLKSLLSPAPSADLSKSTLLDLHKNRINAVENQTQNLQRSLRDYVRYDGHNAHLCDQVSNVIDSAISWSSEIRSLYQLKEVHKKSQGIKLYESLSKFSTTDMDIFNFLKRFESSTEEFDYPEERAELLFNKFLSSSIQEEMVKYKGNYTEMKRILLARYGDAKTIMSNLLAPVTKETLPQGTGDVSVSLSYYRKLQSGLQKISALLKSQDPSQKDMEIYVTSQEFLFILLNLVPLDAKGEFFKQMNRLNEDTLCIRGITPFKLILSSVNETYEFYDRVSRTYAVVPPKARSNHDRPKHTRAHHASAAALESSETATDSESNYESESDQGCQNLGQVNFQRRSRESKELKPRKPVSRHEFPCVLSEHKHSLSDCREFFLKSPKERVEGRKLFKFRHCLLCLQSNNSCSFRKCENLSSIPKVLVCQDCKNERKENKGIYSVLFCFKETHFKPPNVELLKALESYIPGFKPSTLKAPITLVSHFQVMSLSKTNERPKSLTSPVNEMELPPVFNTNTGDIEQSQNIDLIDEVREDSIAVMQTLNIKGRLVLTLFDRGANQNLVRGRLAEELGFKSINQSVSAIGVVSGGQIWTEYGSYQTYLGPNPQGKYFELVCQGISEITSSFPKYELTNVNQEALDSGNLPVDSKFPPYVGGDSIGLLVGLKASELEPECIFTLPSGVGVYKSQFCDAFGSRYCYGGPNKYFTSVNKRFHGNVSFIKAYLTQTISQYRNSLYPSILEKLEPELVDSGCGFSRIADPKLSYSFESYCGQDVMPTPLNAADFNQLGQAVNDEVDNSLSTCPNVHCTCLPSNVYKAKIPLSKQRSYLDEDDIDDTINFKCIKCQKCKCSTSNREKMISVNEQIEQQAIEDSVNINLDEKKVEVDLPFIIDPDKFLSEKHGGMDNYKQAHRVYKSQCRLPDSTKEGIRASISDLQEKGFLKKLSDLPPEHQALIGDGQHFSHYMPWRIVSKKESTSTPIRPVVDPTMSGLNLCLAKGSNRLRKINDILIRARCKKYLWSSDISKLYNRLSLKPSSYTYQLFLYHSSLDPDVPPEIFVMVVCWYGVTSSANQSCYALEELARLLKDKYPLAYVVISNDTYVDDMLSGAHSEEERQDQIHQVSEVLKAGGFQTKFIIQSGQSCDEEFLRILGYRWSVTQDFLSPGFTEVNFSKKRRGTKDPLPFPVETPSDVSKLLESIDITRRMVISKIAEFFDPVGLWEAYKFQLKLASNVLNGLGWDSALPKEAQDFWLSKFQELLQLPLLKINRYVFPPDVKVEKVCLICTSDAAANAGGGIVYAGIKLTDGSYSCKLLSSRSKLLKESVPRNELEAIRVVAGLAYDIKHSLGDMVSDVIFVTDSVIALSWCHNLDKRLRLYCFNRVSEILRLIQSIMPDLDSLPLYHCDGKINPADLVTKPNNLSPKDLTEDSLWVNGYDWMKLPTSQMPLTSYQEVCASSMEKEVIGSECFPEAILPSQVTLLSFEIPEIVIHCPGCKGITSVSLSDECSGNSFEDPHCLQCSCTTTLFSLAAKAGKGSVPLVNVIKYGYAKTVRILSKVISFLWSLQHKAHKSKEARRSLDSQLKLSTEGDIHQDHDSNISKEGCDFLDCHKCTAISKCNGIPVEYEKYLLKASKDYLFRKESSRLVECMPKGKLKHFHMKDGILYHQSRLPEDAKVVSHDLDFDIFFDGQEISSILPVVSTDSDLFYAILMHIHHNVRKHSGNEATLREVMKTIFPLGNATRVINKVRKHCARCRILLRKTLELELGNHPQSRFQLVPCFYHSMADIAYGFCGKPHKSSRTTIKVYALVIVCLLTSATSILALEGLQTQDVVLALERHSGRHGVPAALYVDQGTQLTNLDKLEGTLRDANLQLRTSLGLKILPSIAKNHCQRGRVERKIRSLRDMLSKVAINTNIRMTPLEWETMFLKMASQIDDLPIARADKSAHSDLGWELLTPNRFKLGRNNFRSIEDALVINDNTTPSQLLKRVQDIQRYWFSLLMDRLHHLIPKPDTVTRSQKVQLEDIVCFRFTDNVNSKMETWKLGKIVEIIKGGLGVILLYVTFLPNGKVKTSCVTRSPRDIVVVSSVDDLSLNSTEFFNKIKKMSTEDK